MDHRENEERSPRNARTQQEKHRTSGTSATEKNPKDSFGERVKILLAQLIMGLKDAWDWLAAHAKSGWKALTVWCRDTWKQISAHWKKELAHKKPAEKHIEKSAQPQANRTSQINRERKLPPAAQEKKAQEPPIPHRAEKNLPASKPVQDQNSTWDNIVTVARLVWIWAYHLRSVLLAIPVAVAAISMAIQNMARLPAKVGLELMANGEFEFMVGKSIAVLGPLAVTAVCLLLMFCSRKVLYPWLISIFSLVLPTLIWITNVFPA